MVTRNRHEGGTPQWWDDLPPQVRSRFSRPPVEEEADEPPARAARPAANPRPTPSRGDLLLDLTRFAMLFFLIAIVILLYLLVALSYVNG